MAREMKPSGTKWVKEIPVGWTVINIRNLFSFGKGLPITKENLKDSGMPVISYGQIHSKHNNGTSVKPELIRFVDEQYLRSNPDSLVKKGDFIFADTSEDILGCGNCIYIDTDTPIFAGYHTIIFHNKATCDRKFFAYLFQSDSWRLQIRERVTGVKLFSISQKILRATSVLVPPIDEQHRITTFLDSECSRIDSVIEQTRASIEEYKKLKQAVITQAVTKGIRPNREMKDSGVEWIGKIPVDWKVCKVRHIGSTQNGISKGGEFFGEGYPFVSYGDVYRNYSLPNDLKGLIQSTDEEQKLYSVQRGDIFFTRTSETIEEVGFSSVCENTIPNATFAGFLIRVRPYDDTLDIGYSKYYFRSNHHRFYLVKQMNLVTRASLGQPLLKSMPVLVPEKEEQQEIASYLDKKCSGIDALIVTKEKLISELEAYKKSLIYEYVTGKKEV